MHVALFKSVSIFNEFSIMKYRVLKIIARKMDSKQHAECSLQRHCSPCTKRYIKKIEIYVTVLKNFSKAFKALLNSLAVQVFAVNYRFTPMNILI